MINLNGQRKVTSAAELSYDDILALNERSLYIPHTVIYRNSKTSGQIRQGDPPLQVDADIKIDVILTACLKTIK